MCYIKSTVLKDFNNFMLSEYASEPFHKISIERWKEKVRINKVGAISDMTLITEFLKNNRDSIMISSLNEVKENSVFDNDINCSSCFYSNEYAHSFGKKKIRWNDGIPFCFNISENKLIKFNCLHLQGPAKYLASAFYTGPKFQGKIAFDLRFFILNMMAYWYKKLKVRYRISFLFNLT